MTASGLLVLCLPEHEGEVALALSELGWATVHPTDTAGHLIVTTEASSTDEAIARHLLIRTFPHVIAADMVEHHVGDDEQQTDSRDAGLPRPAFPETTR